MQGQNGHCTNVAQPLGEVAQPLGEVVQEVVQGQNGHCTDVPECAAQPLNQNLDQNFSCKSLEPTKIVERVSDDTEPGFEDEDREWQIGDRIQHQISKKVGIIKSLNKDKSLAKVEFTDGTESPSLYTRMFIRVSSQNGGNYHANG